MINFIVFCFFLFIVILFLTSIGKIKSGEPAKDEFSYKYKRKNYLFDTNSEFKLYKILLEVYNDKYFIFPQINYNHLIEPRMSSWREERALRSRIDRKSADFVFCDKDKIIPCLVVELDGSVHFNIDKQKRDRFIDRLTKAVGIPILHIAVSNVNKDYVKEKIDKILYPSDVVDSDKQLGQTLKHPTNTQ